MPMPNQPPYLKAGDKIAILSTARKISLEELNPAIAILKKWGLEVVIGESIEKVDRQFAGDDVGRVSDLQNMLDDTSIKAILCARGGYGTIRIIDQIDFTGFVKNPKWVCGFSDITVLHSHIQRNYGIPTIHSIMPSVWKDATDMAVESLRKALFGEALSYTFGSYPLNKVGEMKGILVGGNSSLLFATLGSASEIHTQSKVLFIEDLDEYLYHMDRMMISLKRAGTFKGLSGLLVGGMTDMKDNEVPFGRTIEEIISEVVIEENYPVCFNFPCGHWKDNHALKLGMDCIVYVSEQNVRFEQN